PRGRHVDHGRADDVRDRRRAIHRGDGRLGRRRMVRPARYERRHPLWQREPDHRVQARRRSGPAAAAGRGGRADSGAAGRAPDECGDRASRPDALRAKLRDLPRERRLRPDARLEAHDRRDPHAVQGDRAVRRATLSRHAAMGRRAERGAGRRDPRVSDRSRLERVRTAAERRGARERELNATEARTSAPSTRKTELEFMQTRMESTCATAVGIGPIHPRTALFAALALGALPALSQSTSPGIRIGDTDVFPESVTSTSDGTVYAGSIKGNVYRAAPGESVALPWIQVNEQNGNLTILGVFADEASDTLWLCSVPNFFGPERSQ